jgi:hypothetical protein
MDASERIADEFDRLNEMEPKRLRKCSFAERAIYWIVATRCEIDTNGFSSVYEQLLGEEEGGIVVEGLRRLGEKRIAGQFERGIELLRAAGFYHHRKWRSVPQNVREKIERIEDVVGDRLWDLDAKLVRMLDEKNDGAE